MALRDRQGACREQAEFARRAAADHGLDVVMARQAAAAQGGDAVGQQVVVMPVPMRGVVAGGVEAAIDAGEADLRLRQRVAAIAAGDDDAWLVVVDAIVAQLLAALGEFGGGLSILLGLLTPIACLGVRDNSGRRITGIR